LKNKKPQNQKKKNFFSPCLSFFFANLTQMGSSASKCNIEYDGPIDPNCRHCDQFYPSKEIKCDRCNNTNTISSTVVTKHKCTKLPSGKFGYVYYPTRKCSKHTRCICCQNYLCRTDYWSSAIVTYHLSQFEVFVCNDCWFQKNHENFAQNCFAKQMEYKNNVFHFILLQFHLLPHDLKVIILLYCNFFGFEDYLVNQGYYFWNSE
jgi:hypothetical protein